MRRVALALAALLVTAFGQGCVMHDDCKGGEISVKGSPADYTLQAGDHAGVTLSAPVPCDDTLYVGGQLVLVRGSGARKLGSGLDAGCASLPGTTPDGGDPCKANWSAFRADVASAQPGAMGGLGLFCGAARPADCVHFFQIGDWAQADGAVQAVMDAARSWDLGDCLGVIISGQVVMCPH